MLFPQIQQYDFQHCGQQFEKQKLKAERAPNDNSWHGFFPVPVHFAVHGGVAGGACNLPVDASAPGLGGWRSARGVRILVGLRQSEGGGGGGGGVPLRAGAGFWRQREEQERSGVGRAGRAQVL